jgi:hypothetical protein
LRPLNRVYRPANIFWLGNDLRYAREKTQYYQRTDLLQGLNQAAFHGSELGLSGSAPATTLRSIISEVNALAGNVTDIDKNRLGEKILKVTSAFSELLKTYQRDFSPGPNPGA